MSPEGNMSNLTQLVSVSVIFTLLTLLMSTLVDGVGLSGHCLVIYIYIYCSYEVYEYENMVVVFFCFSGCDLK